jgi:hypothetical protein
MRLGSTAISVTRPGSNRRPVAVPTATYALSSDGSVNEGESMVVTVTTTNVTDGTVLYWSTSNITTSDSDFTATSGTTAITSNSGSFSVATVADSTTEGAETFGITLRVGSQSGTIVASTTNKTINDTSQTPSYSASSASNINEGSALGVTVTTTNVSDGTTLYWTTNHTTTSAADFSSNSGSFTITSNSGTFNVPVVADSATEGAETFTVEIRTGSTSGTIVATLPSITVNDTSLTPTGWNINTATYDSVSSASSTIGSVKRSFSISGDGTKIYLSQRFYNTYLGWRSYWYQWSIATPWDITSSITYDGRQLIGIDGTNGLSWNPTGTKFWRCYWGGQIREWSVPSSDAWNQLSSSATFLGEINLSIWGSIKEIQWAADGSKFFLFTDNANAYVRLFTVSTPFDILSTVTHISASPSFSSRRDMHMKPDGTKVYMTNTTSAEFYQYDLTTAFDPTTIPSTPTYTKNISSKVGGGTLHGVRIKPDGSELITYSEAASELYKYTL